MQKKAFDKIQHPFMIKTLDKVGIEGIYLNIIKAAIYEKSIANIILSKEKVKDFPLESGRRQGCPLLPLPFLIVVECLDTASRQEIEVKSIQIGREVVNCHYMQMVILYTENPKASTQELLELINEFSKIAGYKINIEKSFTFLYTKKEISGKECKQTISFKIASKIK